jgi:hypothetical protein
VGGGLLSASRDGLGCPRVYSESPGWCFLAMGVISSASVSILAPSRAKLSAISPRRVVLDMDSTEIPVYGRQEHSAYNGHFESTCYHPLRPGNPGA